MAGASLPLHLPERASMCDSKEGSSPGPCAGVFFDRCKVVTKSNQYTIRLDLCQVLFKLTKQFISLLGDNMFNSILTALRGVWRALTGHHPLHDAEHVGQFAGSLLPKEDWDH